MELKKRLSEIFVSQKFIMFSLCLVFIALFIPPDGRQSSFITTVGTFGVMKAVDYARAAYSVVKGGPNGLDSTVGQ